MAQPERITIDTPIVYREALPSKVDVVIIGGGVIGVFTALYLARKGIRVLICEKGRIAGEQSSRNWGWIRQHGRDEAELPVMMQSLKLWHEVNRETGGACGVRTVGVNYLASTEASMQVLESWIAIAGAHGLESRMMSKDEVAANFSGVSNSQWVGGVCTPSDSRGEPWTAVPAVARLAHQSGAVIRENCAVRALESAGGQICGVITEHGAVACEQVLLAAGAWSSLFARRHGIDIPQLNVRSTVAQTVPLPEFTSSNSVDEQLAIRRREDGGFTLALADRHDIFPGKDAIRHLRSYLPVLKSSWKTVRIHPLAPAGFPDAWGTARNWRADQKSPFETIRVLEPPPKLGYLEIMVDRFASRFPEVGRPRILSSWAGMIDAMPDVVPIVDRVSTPDGLVIATGMSGHGFGIGPGFGRCLSRMLTGQPPEHDLSRFRFARFTDGSAIIPGSSL